VDLSIFKELIKKHHPNGMLLLEDIKKINSDEDNPLYQFRFPFAIIEFKLMLKVKYNNNTMELPFLCVFLKN